MPELLGVPLAPALVLAAVAAGALAQAVTGMGFSLVAAPALVLALGPERGVPAVLLLAVLASLVPLTRDWRHVRVPDATRLLDRIEAAGFIRRERSREDRRFVTTRITEEGLRLLADLDEVIQDLHQRQFEAVDEEGLRALIDLLGLVRERK